MNDRQKKILAAVVREYTDTAMPVSSKVLAQKYDFIVSSATIRNDMNLLEEEGLLHQPHISAGRIPTDKGFRFFVEEVMPNRQLSKVEQESLQAEVLKLKAKNARLTRTTAKLLSTLSGNLAISGLVDDEEYYDFGIKELFDKPEFRELDEVCRIAEVLDYVDEKIAILIKDLPDGETKIFIGKENPLDEVSNCSMIVSSYKTKKGEKGVLALIGPKRMEYSKNKSLIEYMKKLLGSSLAVVLIINVI